MIKTISNSQTVETKYLSYDEVYKSLSRVVKNYYLIPAINKAKDCITESNLKEGDEFELVCKLGSNKDEEYTIKFKTNKSFINPSIEKDFFDKISTIKPLFVKRKSDNYISQNDYYAQKKSLYPFVDNKIVEALFKEAKKINPKVPDDKIEVEFYVEFNGNNFKFKKISGVLENKSANGDFYLIEKKSLNILNTENKITPKTITKTTEASNAALKNKDLEYLSNKFNPIINDARSKGFTYLYLDRLINECYKIDVKEHLKKISTEINDALPEDIDKSKDYFSTVKLGGIDLDIKKCHDTQKIKIAVDNVDCLISEVLDRLKFTKHMQNKFKKRDGMKIEQGF